IGDGGCRLLSGGFSPSFGQLPIGDRRRGALVQQLDELPVELAELGGGDFLLGHGTSGPGGFERGSEVSIWHLANRRQAVDLRLVAAKVTVHAMAGELPAKSSLCF